MGAAAARIADPDGRKVLHGIFRQPVHGADPGRGGRPLHRTVRAGAVDLGCRHRQPMGRVPRFFRAQHRPGASPVRAGPFFRAAAAAAKRRRVDDLGAQTDGLGPGRHGGIFHPADSSGSLQGVAGFRCGLSRRHSSGLAGQEPCRLPGLFVAENRSRRGVPGSGGFLGSLLGHAGAGRFLASLFQGAAGPIGKRKPAGDHRLLCGLVRPLPGTGGDHVSRRRRGTDSRGGFHHDQGGCHPGRKSA